MSIPSPVKSAIALFVAWLVPFAPASHAADAAELAGRAVAEVPAIESDKAILKAAKPGDFRMRIDLRSARATLFVGEKTAIVSPICSGRRTHPTPLGSFTVQGKAETRALQGFGSIVDSDGALIAPVAYVHLDQLLPGQRFERAEAQLVLDLGKDAPVIHSGRVGPLPCSNGSVIVPEPFARLLIELLPTGCPVEIVADEKAVDSP